jgi:hypothetical protein
VLSNDLIEEEIRNLKMKGFNFFFAHLTPQTAAAADYHKQTRSKSH